MQIGPVPLRPDLVRLAPRPESTNTRPDASNTRPNLATKNTRPKTAQLNHRPNPTGRSETDLTRPKRPVSRCPPARPVSPYTDWPSLSDNAEVITIPSEDDDYVPRSPEYELDSPGPVQETEDWNPTPGDHDHLVLLGLCSQLYLGMPLMRGPDLLKRGPHLLLVEEPLCRGFPLFKGNRTKEKALTRQNKAYLNFD